MKYNQPYGVTDTDASYINGTPSSRGSVIPAAAVEQPQREIVNAISSLGMTPSTAVDQLGKAIKTMTLNWSNAIDYDKRRIVIGSDNFIYVWKKASGPSTKVVNPVTDIAEEYWLKYNPSPEILNGDADNLGIVKLSDDFDTDLMSSDNTAATPSAVSAVYRAVLALEGVISEYQTLLADAITNFNKYQRNTSNRIADIETRLNLAGL